MMWQQIGSGIRWSGPGRGAAHPPASGRFDESSAQARAAGNGVRVFVVEDESVIAMDLSERLAALGYEVCGTATRGETAVQRIVELRPNLVLMDVRLAGSMDGVEAAQQLRERYGVPVVFLTAYSDPELIARASGTKAYGYLVKPVEERELHAALQVALARARAEAELEDRVAERTRELRDALTEMESFSYAIAHDLRSPLRALSGYATIIIQEHSSGLDTEAAQMLRKIDNAARRMGEMIDGLLEFARLGRQPVRRMAVRMRHLAQEAASELREPAGEHGSEIRIGDMPDAVGDPLLVHQVWRNLLANAVKFSVIGDAPVIDAGFDAATGAWYVCDNGVGFDMDYADRLFRPFSRLHGVNEFEGTGIGLALAARVVQRHGGRIWADAAPGRGACFYFTLGADSENKGENRP